MNLPDSLEGRLTRKRAALVLAVVVALLCAGAGAYIFQPVPISTGNETPAGESLADQPIATNGSYTANLSITHNVSTGRMFPFLADGNGLTNQTEGYTLSQTVRSSYDADRAIGYRVTTEKLTSPFGNEQGREVIYDTGDVQYHRINSTSTNALDQVFNDCEREIKCFPLRPEESKLLMVRTPENEAVVYENPFATVPTHEFRVQETENGYTFVPSGNVESVSGTVETSNESIVKVDASLTAIPRSLLTTEGNWEQTSYPQYRMTRLEQKFAPRSDVTMDMNVSSGTTVPDETPAWVVELQDEIRNRANGSAPSEDSSTAE